MPPVNTRLGLWAIFAATLFQLAGIFMLSPLLLLMLKRAGVSSSIAGLYAATSWLGILLITPFAARLTQHWGRRRSWLLSSLLPLVCALGFYTSQSLPLWFVLELLAGMAGGMRWVLAEAYVAELAPPAQRGRYIGMYATTVGLTFVIGPTLLAWVGDQGPHALHIVMALLLLGWVCGSAIPHLDAQPSATASATEVTATTSAASAASTTSAAAATNATTAAAVPSTATAATATANTITPNHTDTPPALRGASPAHAGEASVGWQGLLHAMRAHPAILLVGLLGGIFELGLSSILPLYGLALDLPSNTATLLVAISGLGGTLFAIPAGMLADRFHSPAQGRRRMMHALVSVLLLSAVASAWVPSSLPYLGSIVCIWGGAGGALYTLAMTDIGAREQGTRLVNSTAVLVLTYTSGGMLASGLSGWLIDLSPTRLFPLVLISVAALGWVGLRRLR